MNHPSRRRFPLLSASLLAAAAALTVARLPAQAVCYNFGSTPVAAHVDPAPVALACPYAPNWPQWHLLTPPHRMPTQHIGFNPGDAWQRPALLVTWRCTNFLFVPVAVARVRLMGYVVDQREFACDPGTTVK